MITSAISKTLDFRRKQSEIQSLTAAMLDRDNYKITLVKTDLGLYN